MNEGLGALPRTVGELRRSSFSEEKSGARTVRDEVRENLIRKLRAGANLFPGIVGFDDTVVPQVVNALLARQNFILLGLRGQAKTRLLRMLASLLDEDLPFVEGCEIHDNPYRPICRRCRQLTRERGDETPVAWLKPEERYVEKLATPDVTIADILGDIDPIRAAREGRAISDELNIHYGLLPRSNRGIFAVNELPDLAGKIQVGLFNIMQEGDVQIKGYPVRLPLDVLLVFTANPEDYTARGKIITPLKDRIGGEIRTHYPAGLEEGMKITRQEAWLDRPAGVRVEIPPYIAEVVEQLAFQAREDKRIDRRSGVSQRLPISTLEAVVSNAERRALVNGEALAVPRLLDVYAALPSVTGKLELEYEGELKGGESVARELIRISTGKVFGRRMASADLSGIVQWFEDGGSLKLDELAASDGLIARMQPVPGLFDQAAALQGRNGSSRAVLASAAEFILEGLYAQKRISRSEQAGFYAEPKEPGPIPAVGRKMPPGDRRRFN